MRVAMVVPDFLSGTSFLQQPIDFLYAATILERDGFDVSVIDCRVSHISHEQLTKQLTSFDLIVITTTPCDQVQNYFLDYRYAYAMNTINHVKCLLPEIPLVVCGAHVSVRPDLVLREVNADIYLMGEIILAVAWIAKAIRNKSSLSCVPNIIWKKGSEIITNPINEELYHPNLDSTVLPDYSKIPMASYFGVKYISNIPLRRLKRAVVQSGRGCPYNCEFCHNFYGKKINRRSPEVVAEELYICQHQYGIEEIFFLDEVFTLDLKWLAALVELVKHKGVNLEYTIQTRADLINKESLLLMRDLGVRNIWLGVESANDEILTLSHKGINVGIINSAIEEIKDFNIVPNAFFMLGMPGETVQTINSTIRELYQSKLSYTRSLMICTPRYNTPLYKIAEKQYPFVSEHWFNLNAVKGLVANEMTPYILQKAKSILKDREFLFRSTCPQI